MLCVSGTLRKEKRESVQSKLAVTANKSVKKIAPKIFNVKVRIERPCVSHCYCSFQKTLRRLKEK